MIAKEKKVNIVITGFIKDQEELFKHYFSGDMLVLPSQDEPWGLVVNEAMAAGLPVNVSKNCGCSYDLINGNGYIFETGNINELASLFDVLYENNLYIKLGEKSNEIIKEWNNNKSSEYFKKVVDLLKYS